MATNYNYITGIPATGNTPAEDYLDMQTNTNSTSQILSTDHLSFNQASNPTAWVDGMHTVIHLVEQGSDPAAVVDTSELYSKENTYNSVTDSALFMRSSGGTILQMTSAANTQANGQGYTFLPGGIIMAWGSATTTGTSTPISFSSSGMPAGGFGTLFVVHAQPYAGNPANVLGFSYGTNGGTNSGFNFYWPTHGSGSINFTWIAIGK